MRAQATEIAASLGLNDSESMTLLALAGRCEKGLPISCFKRLRTILAPECRHLLDALISPASLGQRKHGKLTSCESDSVVRMADCWLVALRVFQDEAKARRWLEKPHAFLGGHPPLQIAATSTCGAEAVDQLLGRLHYGSAA
jgi:putative toxin-antitoxin system antitoxin component (TIGR02293 family)